MKKILLIEDEASIRSLYAQVLREQGFEVAEAAEGSQGRELIFNGPWDLLLLDIMLPQVDGVELLRQIKMNEGLKNKPVLIISNLEEETVQRECRSLGISEFLIKSSLLPQDIINFVKKYTLDTPAVPVSN
ncbi:response regulator [Patescibacteria group bacterium]|nr:response regulator [Patescibacteria group bacterium]